MEKASVELDLPPLEEQAPAINPRLAVLLVVDMQNEGCHPKGYRYGGQEAEEAVENIATLVDRARQEQIKVIWFKSVRTPDQPIFSVYGHDLYRIDGTWSVELAAPLAPLPDEPVIKKRSHDVFNDTGFEDYLSRHGIMGPVWTFIVVGQAFHACVHEAVTGLSMRDYRVVVPMDCVNPRTGTRATVERYNLTVGCFPYNISLLTTHKAIEFALPPEAEAP